MMWNERNVLLHNLIYIYCNQKLLNYFAIYDMLTQELLLCTYTARISVNWRNCGNVAVLVNSKIQDGHTGYFLNSSRYKQSHASKDNYFVVTIAELGNNIPTNLQKYT